jgi:16S rRNA (cytosine967-C5)-methyltransferase
VQDEGESLVTCLVDPKPGEWIADPCAAPGTKATHLVERGRGAARVAASDVVPARAAKIPQAVARLGLQNVHVFVADLARYPSGGVFDAVLLDAPCSGLGVLSRRADARWRKSEESIVRAVSIQRSLLLAAAGLVRPGGRLVYSVCSVEPEEGWGVVTGFLDNRTGFRVEPAGDLLPGGIVDERGALMALPHVHGTDGVFAVRLRLSR